MSNEEQGNDRKQNNERCEGVEMTTDSQSAAVETALAYHRPAAGAVGGAGL